MIFQAQISELRLQLEQAKSDKAKRFELPKTPLLEMKETVAQVQREMLQPQLQMQQKNKMKEEKKKKTVIATPPAQIQCSQLKQQVLRQLMDKERNEGGGRQAEQTEHAKYKNEEEHEVEHSQVSQGIL